jgi:hypothetical protein
MVPPRRGEDTGGAARRGAAGQGVDCRECRECRDCRGAAEQLPPGDACAAWLDEVLGAAWRRRRVRA